MMQVSEHIPKPSDDEIARVVAWRKIEAFQRVQKVLEDLAGEGEKGDRLHYMGELVDERFSKRALLGAISAAYRTGGNAWRLP